MSDGHFNLQFLVTWIVHTESVTFPLVVLMHGIVTVMQITSVCKMIWRCILTVVYQPFSMRTWVSKLPYARLARCLFHVNHRGNLLTGLISVIWFNTLNNVLVEKTSLPLHHCSSAVTWRWRMAGYSFLKVLEFQCHRRKNPGLGYGMVYSNF